MVLTQVNLGVHWASNECILVGLGGEKFHHIFCHQYKIVVVESQLRCYLRGYKSSSHWLVRPGHDPFQNLRQFCPQVRVIHSLFTSHEHNNKSHHMRQ